MDKDTVITIDGNLEQRNKCRNIRGEFYIVGDPTIENSGHCYFINDKYYKQNTGYIVYDHALGTYVLKNNALLKSGVVGFSDKNTPIIGMFSTIGYDEKIQVNYNNNLYPCMNSQILENTNFLEDLNTNGYYHRQSIKSSSFSRIGNIPNGFKNNLLYDSRDLTKKQTKIYNELYNPVYADSITKYGDVLKGLTFGLEFETVNGYVPQRLCDKLGLIPLKDGSIQGLEYVTIPLQHAKGMQTIIDSVKELSKRTIYNKDCSLHLHIGNIPRTEEFFLALFKILCLMENSMFDLFPVYKKYNYGVKKKHYTKPFTMGESMYLLDRKIDSSNIKQNFDILYRYLSMGQSYNDVNSNLANVNYHPSDPQGNAKWNIRTRYHWVNLIPLLFGNKQTIEFRLHTPTYDVDKILNYLVICGALINFVKENTAKILKDFGSVSNITLTDILCSAIPQEDGKKGNGDSLLNNLIGYISSRRDFMYYAAQKGNIQANEDDFNPYKFWLKRDNKNSISPLNPRRGGVGMYNGDLHFNRVDIIEDVLRNIEEVPLVWHRRQEGMIGGVDVVNIPVPIDNHDDEMDERRDNWDFDEEN
jgi:hypothetical protein